MKTEENGILKKQEISDLVINSLPGVFYLHDQAGKCIRWNKNFETISGYSAEEIRNLSLLDFFDPKDHVRVMATFMSAFEKGEAEIEIETITKSGTKIPYYFSGKAVNYEGSLCLIGMGIDISERILAKNEIKKSQERLNDHINNSPLAVIEYDKDLKITFWSKRASDLFGWTEEEVSGKKVTEFLIHKDDINTVTGSLLLANDNTSEKGPIAARNYTKDGRVLYCRWHNSFLTDQYGKIETVMSIIRDISDLWKAELQREEMASDLIKRNTELEQFTYIVSHNLRAPVASLIGLTNLLSEYDLNEKEKRDIVRGISQSATRLDDVIRDLNDILHFKTGLNGKREMVSFSKLVSEIEQNASQYFENNKFYIETDFSTADELYTLKNYMVSIFNNLISNSIKYKQPNADPVIKIKSELHDQKLILTFKDNGIGVDLNKIGDDLFGLYKRFHFHVEGKGLGLFMVKTQVEILGGKIAVASAVGKGTEFRIEFDL